MELSEAIRSVEPQPAVYIVTPIDGSYLYKGACRNLRQRMRDHLAGRVSRTKNRRPLLLVYFEYTDDFTQARNRESWLKTGAGRDYLHSILNARVAKWQTQRT